MQKSIILAVFGSVVVFCVAAQMFSVQRSTIHAVKTIPAYVPRTVQAS